MRAGGSETQSTAKYECRAGLSFTFAIPQAEFIVRKRLKEFRTHIALALKKTNPAVGANRFNRDDAHDGLALAAGCNLNLFTIERTLNKLGKVRFGLKHCGFVHIANLLSYVS